MKATSKALGFLIVMLLVFSSLTLISLTPVRAQSTSAPGVPQFTLKLVGPPIVVSTTYSLDPNTGEIIANIGYTYPYSQLEIIVTNQAASATYGLPCLDVQFKDHNATGGWQDFYAEAAYDAAHDGPFSWINAQFTDPTPYPCEEAGTNYTIIGIGGEFQGFIGSTIDIQVRAFWSLSNPSPWSATQTITIPANTPLSSTATSTSPTGTPTSPAPAATSTPNSAQTATDKASSASFYEVTSAAALVAIAFLLIVIIGLLVYIRKQKIA